MQRVGSFSSPRLYFLAAEPRAFPLAPFVVSFSDCALFCFLFLAAIDTDDVVVGDLSLFFSLGAFLLRQAFILARPPIPRMKAHSTGFAR